MEIDRAVAFQEQFFDEEVTGEHFHEIALYREPVDVNALTLQKTEVDEVRWFPLEKVWEEIKTDRSRFCVPTGGLEVLRGYLKQISTDS